MKRDRLTFVAALVLFGSFVLGLSVQCFADEKDRKAAAKEVKFACSQHGPKNMRLTLIPKMGVPPTGKPQMIEFIGGDDFHFWVVKIDGNVVKVDNDKTVDVWPKDSITWSVDSPMNQRTHGVVFADQDVAQALLDFDMKVGKKLEDQSKLAKSDPDWGMFGPKLWGTDPTDKKGLLASCKVK